VWSVPLLRVSCEPEDRVAAWKVKRVGDALSRVLGRSRASVGMEIESDIARSHKPSSTIKPT